LEESQAGIKIASRNINNLRYADDTALMAENEEELKNLLMRMKESEKNWLKDHGVWSHHLMVDKREKSGNGNKFYLLGHQCHCGW